MTFAFSISRLVMLAILFSVPAIAQISITTLGNPGAYEQDFDFLGDDDYSLLNNISQTGIYAVRSSGDQSPNVFIIDSGSGTGGNFRNYGSDGSPDRAFGSLASSSTGTMFYGFRFRNDTTSTINAIEVRFTGEQWHSASAGAQNLVFSYITSGSPITDVTSGIYTGNSALSFTTPNTSGVGEIDGNAPGNRSNITATFGVNIIPGGEIMLRWSDPDDGANHGISIDDLVVIAHGASTAADAEITGRVLAANGRPLARTRVILGGDGLSGPVYALTNPFGYYRFDGLDAGKTYTLTVSSKTHTFLNPTRVISLSEDAVGVDFMAEPK